MKFDGQIKFVKSAGDSMLIDLVDKFNSGRLEIYGVSQNYNYVLGTATGFRVEFDCVYESVPKEYDGDLC